MHCATSNKMTVHIGSQATVEWFANAHACHGYVACTASVPPVVSPQTAIHKVWGGLQALVESVGERAVEGIASLNAAQAARQRKLLPSHLRDLRSLHTPAARHQIIPALQEPHPDLERLSEAIHRALGD